MHMGPWNVQCRFFFLPELVAFRRVSRHDRGPVPGGNRSAASCPRTVLRRASYHYATRSPLECPVQSSPWLRPATLLPPPEQQLEPKARDTTGVTEKIKIHVLSGLKTSVVRNSSAHVRTESQSKIGHTRKKNSQQTEGGSRGAPFGEGTLSPLRRYLKPLPKGDGGRGG